MRLHVKTIRGVKNGPSVLITGGVHGDEFEPMVAIRQLAQRVDPEALSGELKLVPIVNEAAFRHEDRVAEDGLDLARTCPGKSDGSVTERTARALSDLIGTADVFIDLHTAGTKWKIVPFAGYTLHHDAAILQQQRQMARAFNLPLIWGTTAGLDGRSMSVARDAKVPAIYAEWGGAAICDPAGIRDYVDGCLNVMGHLDMIKRDSPPSRVKYVVEDDREESGHLQRSHPALFDGFFEPTVTLGQMVKIDDMIGTVQDFFSDRTQTVCAQGSGLLVWLRTFCHVGEGDSLAAIVEIDPSQDQV